MQEQTHLPKFSDIVAEGSSSLPENIEPASIVQTAEFPIVNDYAKRRILASETGVAVAVTIDAEGQDDGDTQDSSSTSGEMRQEVDK